MKLAEWCINVLLSYKWWKAGQGPGNEAMRYTLLSQSPIQLLVCVYTTPTGYVHIVQPTIKWVSAFGHRTRGWNLLGAQYLCELTQCSTAHINRWSQQLSMNYPQSCGRMFLIHIVCCCDNMKHIKFITKVFILLLYDAHSCKFHEVEGNYRKWKQGNQVCKGQQNFFNKSLTSCIVIGNFVQKQYQQN